MSEKPIDPMALVDPELRGPLAAYEKIIAASWGSAGPELLKAIRERGLATAKPFLKTPLVEERKASRQTGGPDVSVYLINSDPQVIRPAILHIHGGGFVAGSALASVADLQVQAKALDCVIVTVEYRLAPETPFPGALDDNYTALLWLSQSAASLGVDPAKIAIQGESAGGGHAAMLALKACDEAEVSICFQALTYPMVDDRTGTSRKTPSHIGTILWTEALNALGWSALLGQAPGTENFPPGAVPARAENLSALPPTFIAVGTLDLFVEENLAFAGRLIAAGVPTELLVVPGAFHGFYVMAPGASVSKQYQLAHLNALARAFGRPMLSVAPEVAPWATAQSPEVNAQ